MNMVKRLPFQHGELVGVVDPAGRGWVSMFRVCQHLGLNYNRYCTRIEQDGSLDYSDMDASGLPLQRYVSRDHFPAWVMTIRAFEVAERYRPALQTYQRQAADLMGRLFRDGVAVAPQLAADPVQASLAISRQLLAAVDGLASQQRQMGQQLVAVEDVARRAIGRGARPEHSDPQKVLQGRINRFLSQHSEVAYDPADGRPLRDNYNTAFVSAYRQLRDRTGFDVLGLDKPKKLSYLSLVRQYGFLPQLYAICRDMGMRE